MFNAKLYFPINNIYNFSPDINMQYMHIIVLPLEEWIGYTKLDRKNRGILYPSKGNRKCLVKLRNAPLIQKSSNTRL